VAALTHLTAYPVHKQEMSYNWMRTSVHS